MMVLMKYQTFVEEKNMKKCFKIENESTIFTGNLPSLLYLF
jgi:hypothetical protein